MEVQGMVKVGGKAGLRGRGGRRSGGRVKGGEAEEEEVE